MAEPEEPLVEEQLVFGRARRRPGSLDRRWLTAVVVVVALAATAGWYVHRPGSKAALVVTYSGRAVDDAADVIARADSSFVRYVEAEHGARSADARCYFDRAGGSVSTDVALTLFCGPVLFYGGAAPAVWLRYVLAPSYVAGGHQRLTSTNHPETTTPIALPSDTNLERPDRRAAPTSPENLVAPGPPPAERDVLVRVKRDDVPRLPAMPRTSFIGGRDIDIRLIVSGFVPSYGQGLGIRPAPSGEKLLAFELQITPGEFDTLDQVDVNARPPRFGFAVNDGPVRRLPVPTHVEYGTSTGLTRYLVAAVPADVRQADLVVVDAGVTQRLSLLSGVPAAGNIAVLAGNPKDRYGRAESSRTALARVELNGATFTVRLAMSVSSTPYLGYFSPYGPEHASGPDRALLNVTVTFRTPRIRCPGSSCGFSFHGRNFTLSLTDGSPIHVDRNIGNGYLAFDVPASFKTGTVTVAGSTWAGTATVTLLHPYRVQVVFR